MAGMRAPAGDPQRSGHPHLPPWAPRPTDSRPCPVPVRTPCVAGTQPPSSPAKRSSPREAAAAGSCRFADGRCTHSHTTKNKQRCHKSLMQKSILYTTDSTPPAQGSNPESSEIRVTSGSFYLRAQQPSQRAD